MAAITRYAAAMSALSIISAVQSNPFVGNDVCLKTTTTVYTTVTVGAWGDYVSPTPDPVTKAATTTAVVWDTYAPVVVSPEAVTQQYTCPAEFTYPGVTFPTFSPKSLNPNGPFYNPNDFIPFYAEWPGKPTNGHDVPARPTKAPKPLGGASAANFKSPAWQENGRDLTPGLSQEETNGDSKWGLIDCPRLSSSLDLSGVSASASTASRATSRPSYSSEGHSYSSEAPSRSNVRSSAFPSYSISGNHSITSSSFSAATSTFSASTSSFSSSLTSSSISSSSVSSNSSCPQTSASPLAICGSMPDTQVTRTYDFTIAYATLAPDGVQKNGLLVNNQFPGPLVEANWGDWIQITVTNDLPTNSTDQGEGTSLHWHGFLQHDTPYYDGVPSVQQCPISPGKSLTYKFRADHVGTSWYHSHYSAQYAGGALGPIVIHGPTTEEYDEDLGPIMISDWYHADYFSLVQATMSGGLPLSDNILINGKMNYPCENTTAVCTPNAGISKFQFTPGKKYRMRLINPSADAILKFHIDGHNFTVIANDFVPIKPYTTNVVTLGVGQRSDIIVEAVGKSGDAFWMRATAGNAFLGTGCAIISGVVPEGVAAVYYDGADINEEPTSTSGATTAQLTTCQNDDLSLTQALCAVTLDDDEDVDVQDIVIQFGSNGTDFVWFMNNSTFRADYNVALLDHVIGGNRTFEPEWNVYSFDSNKKSVRLTVENTFPLPHPMHLHGHDFNVLSQGVGSWDGTITNKCNTQVRDVQLLPGSGYIVMQFRRDNPGVWPFHCHIAWHVSGGLYVNILESPSSINYQVPPNIKDTCSDWAAWEALGNVPDQIDSGL